MWVLRGTMFVVTPKVQESFPYLVFPVPFLGAQEHRSRRSFAAGGLFLSHVAEGEISRKAKETTLERAAF